MVTCTLTCAESDLYFRPTCRIVVLTLLAQWSVFTSGHGGYVSIPRQSCGIWTLFLCKRFLLFQWICIDAGHVSENAIFTTMTLTTREFMSNLLSSLNYFCQSCWGLIAQENNNCSTTVGSCSTMMSLCNCLIKMVFMHVLLLCFWISALKMTYVGTHVKGMSNVPIQVPRCYILGFSEC